MLEHVSREFNLPEKESCCGSDCHLGRWRFLLDNPLRRLIGRPGKSVSRYVSRGDIVADVGCGPGFFTLPMAEVVGPEGKVYAIDSDKTAIEALKSKAAKNGFENIDAQVASAAEMSQLQDMSLDFIWAKLALCCMADHSGAIKEMKRTLKPDGSAYMSVGKIIPFSKDPRDVSKLEWRSILEGFRIIKEGSSIITRWAVVSPKLVHGSG